MIPVQVDLPLAIEQAFGWRERPDRVTRVDATRTDIYEDAEALAGLLWQEVSVALLEQYPSCVYGMSGPAFAYYLPGIMAAAYSSRRTDLLVVDALMLMLDTSGQPELWDGLLIEHWSQLRPSEYAAVAQWFTWMHDTDPAAFSYDNTYQRIISTLAAFEAWVR